jgi:SAM-dependent methyltransferase
MTDCPVCRKPNASVLGPYRHTHPALAGIQRALCQRCGMVFAAPMPDPDAWVNYNSSYFDNAHGGVATDGVVTAFHSAINQIRCAHVEMYLQEQQLAVASVFEVGPGGAEFAEKWLTENPSTAYHAIESDTACHTRLATLGVHAIKDLGDLAEGTTFDLVVMSHVLEHVTDPVGFLAAMTARLRPGGVIFIEVPCRDWEHKEQDEPHLLFFDKSPMEMLLKGAGFTCIQLSYHGQTIYSLRDRSLLRRAWNSLRGRLLATGIVAPFGSTRSLEMVDKPLERAAVRPFQAHIEHRDAAWWLRAVAIKP